MLGTGLAPSTPGITLMQACGTSLQGAMGSAAKIATGEIESAIAVGSDTTSDAPIVVSKKLAQRLTKASLQKTTLDKLKVFQGFSPAELAPQPPSVAEPRTGLSMGEHCELMAQEWDITRAEQDQLALRKPPEGRGRLSHRLHGRSGRAVRRVSIATTTSARIRPSRSSRL